MSGLVKLSGTIKELTWAEMVKVSGYLASEYPHLIKSDQLDRDGMAAVLVDMADDILKDLNTEMKGEVDD